MFQAIKETASKAMNLATGSLSEARQKAQRVEWLKAEIDRLNETPRNPERDKQLEQHIYELSRLDESVAEMPVHRGTKVLFTVWQEPDGKPIHKPKACPKEQRIWEIGEQLRLLSTGGFHNTDVFIAWYPHLVREIQGLSEHMSLAKGIQLEEERRKLILELRAERDARAEAAWEAIKPKAREAAQRVRELEGKLRGKLEALLGLEAQLQEAMIESRRYSEQAEFWALLEPALAGRRVEKAVSTDIIVSRTPGNQIIDVAQKIRREGPRAQVAG